MSNVLDALATLNRPRLLIQAARLGSDSYDRRRMLSRLLPDGTSLTPVKALESLLKVEAQFDADRRAGAASYSFGKHIELLSAMIVEARLIRRAT